MQFITTNGEFKVLIKNKEIISHSRQKPWIFTGTGNAKYHMHLGNFEIEENLNEKMALGDFTTEETLEGTLVSFSRKGLNEAKVLFTEEKGRLKIKFIEKNFSINRIWLRLKANKEEHIYGCGEQFSKFDLRGKNYPLWVREQGVGRNKKTMATFLADQLEGAGGDYHTTFFPQPTFVSSEKYFCHIISSAYMDFNFKNEEYHELEIWDIPEEVIIGHEDTFIELIQNVTDLLGRQPELPDWVYDGVWIGMQGGTDTVLRKVQNALDKGLKVSAVWAQDWEGKRITYFGKRLMWNWQWDKELYPGLDVEIKNLEARGIKFLGYINPYLATEGNLFKEASQKNLLVKNNLGQDYVTDMGAFMAGHIDLTNPVAFEWYKDVIKHNMIDFGLKGWMADFGEYLPTDAVLHNGVSAEKMHNYWPVLWAKCNREAIEESEKLNEIIFFMRSGYAGSSKYNVMMWAGDQNVDWSVDDGLPSVITSAMSLGMSGFGLQHSDIGGYTTLFDMKRTKELFMRWAELGAFAPVMRTHEGNRPDSNWQFDSDDETLLHFAKMSRIYTILSPYIKQAVKENSLKGTPVIRPLFLHYEDDSKAYSAQYDYLLGRDLIVAPVIEEGKDSRKVYLPKDEWIHLWSGKAFSGGEVEVEAPIGFPPVFYRKTSDFADLFKKLAKA
jgi:alpha-glucosidase